MKCVKCGKTIPENSKFCQYCGVSLERLKKIDIDNKNVVECPACGVKIKKENSFCTNCGAALQKTQKHKTEQKVRRKKQRMSIPGHFPSPVRR